MDDDGATRGGNNGTSSSHQHRENRILLPPPSTSLNPHRHCRSPTLTQTQVTGGALPVTGPPGLNSPRVHCPRVHCLRVYCLRVYCPRVCSLRVYCPRVYCLRVHCPLSPSSGWSMCPLSTSMDTVSRWLEVMRVTKHRGGEDQRWIIEKLLMDYPGWRPLQGEAGGIISKENKKQQDHVNFALLPSHSSPAPACKYIKTEK